MLDFLCVALGIALIAVGFLALIHPGANYDLSTFLGNVVLAIIIIGMGMS